MLNSVTWDRKSRVVYWVALVPTLSPSVRGRVGVALGATELDPTICSPAFGGAPSACFCQPPTPSRPSPEMCAR